MHDRRSEVENILKERRLQCDLDLNSTSYGDTSETDLFCPGLFDGWSCWPDTPANTTARIPCPTFITGFDKNRMAHKECDEFGVWFRHPETNKSWSNYTTCINLDDLSWRQKVISVYVIGYSISLVALVISLALLSYFKALRCARITLHMHLFASFAINNTLWILWYHLVVAEPSVPDENQIPCQILHIVLNYFLLTNYAWMLCEGLYLHTVLISAFISESRLLKWLYLLGWGMPLGAITIYVSVRAQDADDTIQCWMNESKYTTILLVPVFCTMSLNLVFLCNIVRVLLVKLRGGPHVQGSNGPSRTAVQAFRATLLLVPLLGLHYLVIPFRPPEESPWERAYEIISAVTASLQGLCVATLFCFCNGEVVAQVRRKWRTAMFRPRANSCTATTVSYVRTTPGPLPGEEKV